MKKLKQIIKTVMAAAEMPPDEFNNLLWELICYSPKMPVRLQQEQFLNEAERFSLPVNDDYFAERQLTFNGFIWGSGKHKIMITHGWASKAVDFLEIISALLTIENVQVIAFDAPGNGSSEGELSNLLLFIEAANAVIHHFGEPDVVIGHSLGGMANIMTLNSLKLKPKLVISIAPLIRLRENFENSMAAVGVPQEAQQRFLDSFEEKFQAPSAHYNLIDRYHLDSDINHWLAYDQSDLTSRYAFMKDYLDKNPSIKSHNYEGAGHERIIKSPQVIDGLVNEVKAVYNLL